MNPFRSAIVLMLCAAMLMACSGTARRIEQPAASDPLVWPDPPAAARIAYVSSFSKSKDLGISDGFLSVLARVVFGDTPLRLVRPMAIVVRNNTIFVADPGARGVHRFDRNNNEHTLILGDGDRPLPSPVGLALGADGDVYIADSALRQIFVIHGKAPGATPVPLEIELEQPTGIAFDRQRSELFVAETGAHRISVFNRDGRLVRQIGKRGDADGAFNFPTLIWLSKLGELYVSDALNFRVQAFDRSGKWRRTFGQQGDGTGDLARHKGVATDHYGHVYVVDGLFHAVQIFDRKGTFLLSVGGPGSDRGEFWLPSGIFIDDDDTVYIADSFNQRVQVFRYVGGPT